MKSEQYNRVRSEFVNYLNKSNSKDKGMFENGLYFEQQFQVVMNYLKYGKDAFDNSTHMDTRVFSKLAMAMVQPQKAQKLVA